MRASRVLAAAGLAAGLTLSGFAEAAESAPTSRDAPHSTALSVFAATDYLASPGAHGGAFSFGARLGVGDHFAGGLDLGYGLLDANDGAQDRWWVLPTIALVLPTGPATIDLGAGLGVGTASGYASWSGYLAAPFTPAWHYTVPAARLHLDVAFPCSRGLDVFLRAEAATLLGVQGASAEDSVWTGLSIGVRARVL
jgi:hypothetical protein